MGRLNAVVSAPPPRSPERQRLADAIYRLQQAKAGLTELQAAEQRHFEERIAASAALDAAAATLEKLQADEEQIALAEFMGDGTEAEKLRAAHRAVEAAQSRCEQADRVGAVLRSRLRAAEERVAVCEGSLRAAKLAAISSDPAILDLLRRWQDARRVLLGLRPIMQLCNPYFAHGTVWDAAEPFLADIPGAELSQWQAAIKALESDPDAMLPAP
jgi:hypothetical protein